MQRFLSALIPKWLRQFDHKLLIQSPHIWATKAHMLGFALAIFYLLASLWTAIVPIKLQNLPDPILYFWMPIVPLLVILGFWAYKVTHFKRAKQFGEAEKNTNWQEQAIYLLVIVMFAVIPLSLNYQLSQRVANLVSDDVLVAEIDHLNAANNFFRNKEEGTRCSYEIRCFSRFSSDIWFGEKIKDDIENRAVFEHWLISTNSVQEEAIDQYATILNKYSFRTLEIEGVFVLDNFYNRSHHDIYENYGNTELYAAEVNARKNLKLLRRAKAGDTHLLQPDYALVIISALLWIMVLVMVFFKVGARVFWGAFVISILAILVLRTASALMFRFGFLSSPIGFVAILTLLLMLVAWLGLSASQNAAVAKLAFSLLIGFLLFCPLYVLDIISDFYTHYRSWYKLAIIAGPILVLILWNLGLEKRLSNLDASPKIR
ncbi:MAG: hypothetical protein AAFN10_03560 [Bacteroidota bacterium]